MDARGEMYVSGVDRAGCPSWTWRASLHDAAFNGAPERGTRYLICMMERCPPFRLPSAPPSAAEIRSIPDEDEECSEFYGTSVPLVARWC